jgi:hypothetical protein
MAQWHPDHRRLSTRTSPDPVPPQLALAVEVAMVTRVMAPIRAHPIATVRPVTLGTIYVIRSTVPS